MKEPLVSIIMPTYNRKNTIERAINSIIRQTYTNWELLIIDDKSTDETEKIIRNISNRDKRIRYILNRGKKGVSGARNVGLLNARGEYISFLDSDDEWMENHLSDSIEILMQKEVNMSFALWICKEDEKKCKCDTDSFFIKSFGEACQVLEPIRKQNCVYWGNNFLEYILLTGFYCYNINTLVYKASINQNGISFNEKLNYSEDMDFIYRLLSNNSCCLIQDYHYIYYQGEDNLYNFIDRSKIKYFEISEDKKLIERLTKEGLQKNQMRKGLIRLVKKCDKVYQKKSCILTIQKCMAEKYFTIAVLNQNLNIIKSLICLIQALYYGKNRKYLRLFCINIRNKNAKQVDVALDFY